MLNVLRLKPLVAIAPTLLLALPAVAAPEPVAIPEPTKVLPEDTAYVVLLDMRDETWQRLEQYAFFQYLLTDSETPLNPGGLPFLPVGLDYQADIAPWIGDSAAIALLPLGRPRMTALEEHEVMIAPIAQSKAFGGFINTVTELQGTEPETQRYRTLDILYWEPQFWKEEALEDAARPAPPAPSAPLPSVPRLDEGSLFGEDLLKALPEALPEITLPAEPLPDVPGLAIAVFPEFIVVAEHPAAIRAWINQRPQLPEESLGMSDRFRRTLSHPHYDEALGVFYGSLREIVKYSLTDLALPELPFEIPLPADVSPQEIAQLAALQLDSSIEALIYPTARGIRIQGRGYFDDTLLQGLATTVQPAPPEVLNYAPGDSFALLSGQGLATAWEGIAAGLEVSEETSRWLDQTRGLFTTFTGLDLDEDVFSWMDQGFSVFLFPTQETPVAAFLPELQIGLGVALQTSDRATAEATLATLDNVMGSSFFEVEAIEIKGSPASSWGTYLDWDNEPDSFLGHGWISDDTLLITSSLGSLAEIFNLEPAQTLPNSFRFSQSTRDFPEANQGYLYANVSPFQSLAARFFPPDPTDLSTQEFRQLVGSVQAFTGTFSVSEQYLQLDGLIMLAPATAQR